MRSIWTLCGILLATVLVFTSVAGDSDAQGKRGKLPLIRDAEIEALLKDYTTPIFNAASLGKGAVDVYILNDARFNAFVTGRRMFINTGALMISEKPNEIIGVIAHETGHIKGGHLTRLRDRMDRANILGILSALAGAGAMIAGGEAGDAAAGALMMGGQSAIQRDLLAYQRSEEVAADNAAVDLLTKTGQSGQGMLTTFERMGQNLLFSSGGRDPYSRSHPMPRDRIALLENVVRKSPSVNAKDPPQLQLRHDMARAKIAAYSGRANQLRSMFSEPSGVPARYGLAIALFLTGSIRDAIPTMDRLISEQPKNPYLYEMRAEMLMRGGQATAAVKDLRKAISLEKHKSGLLRVALGHAYLETRDPKNVDAAIRELKNGLSRDPTTPRGYGLLARAYGQKGNGDLARAAAAQEAYYALRIKEAKRLAKLAQPKLKQGSPEWLRMQDIIDYKPPKK
ncbi:MAG: M48 family metalloprotease [Rhizobiaceae bacterium]